MEIKLYVSGIKEDTKANDLQDAIRKKANLVDAKIIRFAKIPNKAFGLIIFHNEAESEKAIKIFHNSNYEGNIISISKVSFLNLLSFVATYILYVWMFSKMFKFYSSDIAFEDVYCFGEKGR